MKILLTAWLCAFALRASAQRVVFDRNHFKTVNENGSVRYSSELAHNNYLNTINKKLDDVNLNVSSVILVQSIIRRSVTEVNQVLKSGIAIRQINELSAEIIQESNQMIELSRSEPYLLLFAEDAGRQLKNRGVKLVTEVADFFAREGNAAMMDYEKRDALLKKITLELKVMRALCFSMSRSIYWARVNGVLKTANPYRNFISQDERLVNKIITGYKSLKE